MNFFIDLFREQGIRPPRKIVAAFNDIFKQTRNVEWSEGEDYFEAVFYHENTEHISRFNKNGHLINFRINRPPADLSSTIKMSFSPGREVMNVVEIHEPGAELKYEIITRDQDLTRYLHLFDAEGNSLSEVIL